MSIYSQGLCFYFDNIDSVEKRSFVACLYFYFNSTLPLKKETLDNTHIPISSWAIEGCNGLIDWTMKSNFTFENLSFTEFVHCNLLIQWLSLGNLVTSQSIKDSRTFQCWKYWSCWKPGVNVMTGCDGYFWYVCDRSLLMDVVEKRLQRRKVQKLWGEQMTNTAAEANFWARDEVVNKDTVSRNLCHNQNIPREPK